jgi:hypothetical protein
MQDVLEFHSARAEFETRFDVSTSLIIQSYVSNMEAFDFLVTKV